MDNLPLKKVRTRFAPSPTGYMHIGGVRTALYAYLFAKKHAGDFLLRIEDTDRARYVDGAVNAIYRSLRECGLNWDEGPDVGGPVGPYVQSERRDIYKEYAELLIARGGAYRDGDVVRQRIPREGSTTYHDLIFGDVTVANNSPSMDEGVLLKSDGLPTYNFANIVDDYLMGITHVVRGTEYLSSTPKYVLMYDALGWQMPENITVAMINRDATHKLSKRDGDPTYEDLIREGYLPDAILNYVALLGWSPGGEREFFKLPELIDAFDLSGISKSPAIFDKVKLTHFNKHYISQLTVTDFTELVTHVTSVTFDTKLAKLVQPRIETLTDIGDESKIKLRFFTQLDENYDLALFTNKKSKTDAASSRATLERVLPELDALETWDEPTITALLTALVERFELKTGALFTPLRVAVSGEAVTPGGPAEICAILGKQESLRRIRLAIERLSQ